MEEESGCCPLPMAAPLAFSPCPFGLGCSGANRQAPRVSVMTSPPFPCRVWAGVSSLQDPHHTQGEEEAGLEKPSIPKTPNPPVLVLITLDTACPTHHGINALLQPLPPACPRRTDQVSPAERGPPGLRAPQLDLKMKARLWGVTWDGAMDCSFLPAEQGVSG